MPERKRKRTHSRPVLDAFPEGAPVPTPAESPSDTIGGVSEPPRRNLREAQMSSTERRFQRDVLNNQGWFEAVTLRLPGGSRYCADFLVMSDGVPTLVECKGSFRLGSQGRAHTAFLEAAALYSSVFRFVWAEEIPAKKGGGWKYSIVVPSDADLAAKRAIPPSPVPSPSAPLQQLTLGV